MTEQFNGPAGQAALLNGLRRQFLINGNTEVAKKISTIALLKQFAPDAILFTEGDRGGDLFFILAGTVSIRKGEREIATCNADMHVGEVGLLEPFKGRSASVVAVDTVAAAHIPPTKFNEIAATYPDLWRRIALGLAHRLVQSQDAV